MNYKKVYAPGNDKHQCRNKLYKSRIGKHTVANKIQPSKPTGIFDVKTDKALTEDILHHVLKLLKDIGVHPEYGEICGINISNQMGGLVRVDKRGSVLTGFDSDIDTKVGYYNERLHEILGNSVQEETCGSPGNMPKIMYWKG